MTLHIRPHGRRFFALYNDEELVVVCVYKVGALAVKERIEKMEERLLRTVEATAMAGANVRPQE